MSVRWVGTDYIILKKVKLKITAVCSMGNFPFPTSVMPKITSTNVLREDKTIKKGIRVNCMWTKVS